MPDTAPGPLLLHEYKLDLNQIEITHYSFQLKKTLVYNLSFVGP